MKTVRTLLLVTAVGAGVSASSSTIADFLSGRDPRSRPVTREVQWDGGEVLIVGVPADVRFIQAPGPGRVVVTGRRRSVDTFHVEAGVLEDGTWRTGERLQIVVTAPRVTRFSVKGRDTLSIEGFDQDELRIETTGRAEVEGRRPCRHGDVGAARVRLGRSQPAPGERDRGRPGRLAERDRGADVVGEGLGTGARRSAEPTRRR